MTETNYERPPIAPAPKWPQYKVTKARNQVKSKFYYIFWGAATVSVVLGQLYVGTGYRSFAQAINRVFDTIEIEVGREYNGRRYY
tara:strand:+ start:407 stop:661 length:255 start_codon:yes stop_codon:yes gene_type:complete